MAKRLKQSGRAVVLLFKEDKIHEAVWLTAWNKLFFHLAIRGKGMVLKVRLDTVRKGDDPCSCGQDSLPSE